MELHRNSSGRKLKTGGMRRHREGRKRNREAEERDRRRETEGRPDENNKLEGKTARDHCLYLQPCKRLKTCLSCKGELLE